MELWLIEEDFKGIFFDGFEEVTENFRICREMKFLSGGNTWCKTWKVILDLC